MRQVLTGQVLRDALESEYSDAYKAANGVRPRWSLAHLSDEALHEEAKSLYLFAESQDMVEEEPPQPLAGDGWAVSFVSTRATATLGEISGMVVKSGINWG